MSATPALTTALRRLVLDLEDDLRVRVEADAAVSGTWKAEHLRAWSAAGRARCGRPGATTG